VCLAALLCVGAALGGHPVYTCGGEPNNNPIIEANPQFIKSVKNGKLYHAGQGDETISVVHVYGSFYDMGYAQGQLLKDEVNYILPSFLQHILTEVDEYVKWIPKPIADWVGKVGLMAALDITYDITKDYTPSRFYDEVQGIADGSGADYRLTRNLQLLGELVKAGCSMFGASDSATPDGSLLQLRALDWDYQSPLNKYPTIIVYHPSPDTGITNDFLLASWAGYIAAISGVNDKGVAISEKHYDDGPLIEDSRIGSPFQIVLREILEESLTLDDAINVMANARRTCSIWVGVGDAKLNTARVFEYSYAELVAWDWMNQDNSSTHPQLKDVVYKGVHEPCFPNQVEAYSGAGNLTAANTIQNVIPVVETGDTQAVIYSLKPNAIDIYVANARAEDEQGPLQAYNRPFVHFDATALFAEQPPSAEAP